MNTSSFPSRQSHGATKPLLDLPPMPPRLPSSSRNLGPGPVIFPFQPDEHHPDPREGRPVHHLNQAAQEHPGGQPD